jgi:hypothetical protein
VSTVCSRFGCVVCGWLLAMAVAAASASANSYDVYACYAGQGTYLNPDDSAASWTLSDNNGAAYYLPFNQCGGSSNGFGVISRSGYLAPSGDFGEVYFKVKGGLHIRRVQLWRSMFDYGQGSGGTSQRNYAENLADGQLPGVGDEFDGSADVPSGSVGSGDTTNGGIVQSNYTSVDLSAALPTTYAYVIGCGFQDGCRTGGDVPWSPNGFDTALKIYGAIVTVEDDLTPSIALANTGLMGGGVQSGTVPLTLSASAVAGIARLEIYAGSSSTPSLAEDFTHTSRCQFWEVVPCQNLSSYLYPADTTKLPNGTYYLTVTAVDPAGNVAAVSSPAPVTVENAQSTSDGASGSIRLQPWRIFLIVAPRHVHRRSTISLSGASDHDAAAAGGQARLPAGADCGDRLAWTRPPAPSGTRLRALDHVSCTQRSA